MNNVVLFGRLTKDIELKYAQNGSGNAIARFTVAVDRGFKNANGDKETDFISCVAFGKTGENISKFFHKGTRIIVQGRIQTGSYQDQQGQTRYTTDVVVNTFSFVETAAESGNATRNQTSAQGFAPAQAAPAQGFAPAQAAPAQTIPPIGGIEFPETELPFNTILEDCSSILLI